MRCLRNSTARREIGQLNYFLKLFSEEHNLESPSNKTEQHYTISHMITQVGCITKPPHYLKNIPKCLNINFSL